MGDVGTPNDTPAESDDEVKPQAETVPKTIEDLQTPTQDTVSPLSLRPPASSRRRQQPVTRRDLNLAQPADQPETRVPLSRGLMPSVSGTSWIPMVVCFVLLVVFVVIVQCYLWRPTQIMTTELHEPTLLETLFFLPFICPF